MAHQHLTFVGQASLAPIAFEEREAENLLKLADRMADGARRQAQHDGCRPEGSCPASGFKNPQK